MHTAINHSISPWRNAAVFFGDVLVKVDKMVLTWNGPSWLEEHLMYWRCELLVELCSTALLIPGVQDCEDLYLHQGQGHQAHWSVLDKMGEQGRVKVIYTGQVQRIWSFCVPFVTKCPGPISQNLSSVTNDSFCYKLVKSLLLIGYQQICHWFLSFVFEKRLCKTGLWT